MGTVRWLDGEEMAAWRAFLHSAIRVIGRLDADLIESHDLTLADYEIISTLSEATDGRLRMSDLSSRALVSKSRLSYRVNRLAERGFVRREDDRDDRRQTFTVLTPRGKRVLEAAAKTHVRGVRSHLIDVATKSEQRTLTTALGRAIASLA